MSKFVGRTGRVIVEPDAITIVRDTLESKATHGGGPPWRIPLAAIADVRLEHATRAANGKIQIVLGAVPPSEGDVSAADTVQFTYKQRRRFEQLARWLRQIIEANQARGVDSARVAVDSPPPSEVLGRRIQRGADRTQVPVEAAPAAVQALRDSRGVIFEGKSHDDGGNATVTLCADRIERVKERPMMSLSSARPDVEVTPVRNITSVQARKEGIRTKVTVYASGYNVDFRFRHAEAQRFREALTNLVMSDAHEASSAATPPGAPDPIDQLKRLAELRDAGILTAGEFDAKKAEMLKRL